MTTFERIEKLRKEAGLSQGKLEKELGFSNGSISKWKNSNPTYERLQKVANFFNVPIEYLASGENEEPSKKLTSGEAGPASYDGEPLDPEAAALFKDELEIALRRLKLINKEKYTPKKYKK